MKKVLIMRHAKSSWDEAGVSDHDRTLNARGHRDAPFMGQFLEAREIRPDRILHSTARRAELTAQIVSDEFSNSPALTALSEFYLAPAQTYLDILDELDDATDCVMLVGHNPGMEELVAHFMSGSGSMPTAAIAHIDLDIDRWQDLKTSRIKEVTQSETLAVWRPKEVR